MCDGTIDRIRTLVADVACPPFRFEVTETNGLVFLNAALNRPCTYSGEFGVGRGGRYLVDVDANVDAVTKTCFRAALDMAEHEVREAFTWQGRRVLGPHIPLDRLAEVAV